MTSDQGISHILEPYDLSSYTQNFANWYYPNLAQFGPQAPIPCL